MKTKTVMVFVLIFFAQFAKADLYHAPVCYQFTAPLSGGFCVNRPVQNANTDLLYYFHGRGDGLENWGAQQFYTQQLRDEWAKTNATLPTVINVSFGPIWVLAEKNKSRASGLFEVFTKMLMPQIEAALGQTFERRLLLGESMGGFNTLQLALKTQMFAKAAALCAPVARITPFAEEAEVTEFIEASAAWSYYRQTPEVVVQSVNDMLRLARYFYPDIYAWLGADPLILAKTVDVSSLPDIYMAAGMYDRYAAYEGNLQLANELISRGAHVEWRPQWGGHCAIDIPSLAQFLTR